MLPHAPKLEARGDGREEQPMPKARGGNERSYPASEVRGSGREEIPHAPSLRPGAVGGRSYPTLEARDGGREDQPHAVAERAQQGLEEVSHVEGQEGLR